MADRVGLDNWCYRHHFKWALPMKTGAKYATMDSLYRAVDDALTETFGLSVAASNVHCAGYFIERSPVVGQHVTYMFEVNRDDVGAASTPPTGSSSYETQYSRMMNDHQQPSYPFGSPPNCYTRYDLLHCDQMCWQSDVRDVLFHYFLLCDQHSAGLLERRHSTLGGVHTVEPCSATYEGKVFESDQQADSYASVPSICKSALGLANPSYLCSANKPQRSFEDLSIQSAPVSPRRNTVWDAEAGARTPISRVCEFSQNGSVSSACQ